MLKKSLIIVSFGLAVFPASSLADDNQMQVSTPQWVAPIPAGNLSCFETNVSWLEWNGINHAPKKYRNARYQITKLSTKERLENPRGCDPDTQPSSFSLSGLYNTASCYRYSPAFNILDSAQEWCRELYREDTPPQVLCESDNAQPKLNFTPGDTFVSYGRIYAQQANAPFMEAVTISSGLCGRIQPSTSSKSKP